MTPAALACANRDVHVLNLNFDVHALALVLPPLLLVASVITARGVCQCHWQPARVTEWSTINTLTGTVTAMAILPLAVKLPPEHAPQPPAHTVGCGADVSPRRKSDGALPAWARPGAASTCPAPPASPSPSRSPSPSLCVLAWRSKPRPSTRSPPALTLRPAAPARRPLGGDMATWDTPDFSDHSPLLPSLARLPRLPRCPPWPSVPLDRPCPAARSLTYSYDPSPFLVYWWVDDVDVRWLLPPKLLGEGGPSLLRLAQQLHRHRNMCRMGRR